MLSLHRTFSLNIGDLKTKIPAIRNLVVITISVVSFCCCLFLGRFLVGHGSEKQPIPLIIFKIPRSGSSWFTQKLNTLSSVYISKEILQRGDMNTFSVHDVETYLSDAMKNPRGKFRSKANFLTSIGRFFEDYVFSLKFLSKLEYVGFTLNPEHSYGALAKLYVNS